MKNITPKLNINRLFPDNLVSAHELLLKAKLGQKGNNSKGQYAIPAFNVTTFQGINAVFNAFEILGSSGIIAFSNSALKHFGEGDQVFGLELVANYIEKKSKRSSVKIATHLDHGDYSTEEGRTVLQNSVRYLTSVMADNSTDHKNKKARSLNENIELTREVVNLAHPLGVSVEGELGVLAGEEDEDTKSEFSTYTNPSDLSKFLLDTGVLLLAPTIGTMHGPNKGKPGDKVKLNTSLAHELLTIANKINNEIIFVAHGASTLYENVRQYAIDNLQNRNNNSEEILKWSEFVGTDWEQIKELISAGFCKINTDTENRQTYLASLIGSLNKTGSKIDIRYYDKITTNALTQSYIKKLIMAGNYGVWHEPKINIDEFKFDLNILS